MITPISKKEKLRKITSLESLIIIILQSSLFLNGLFLPVCLHVLR
jgi:hypothetical protein